MRWTHSCDIHLLLGVSHELVSIITMICHQLIWHLILRSNIKIELGTIPINIDIFCGCYNIFVLLKKPNRVWLAHIPKKCRIMLDTIDNTIRIYYTFSHVVNSFFLETLFIVASSLKLYWSFQVPLLTKLGKY